MFALSAIAEVGWGAVLAWIYDWLAMVELVWFP